MPPPSCPACGASVYQDEDFCGACGRPLRQGEPSRSPGARQRLTSAPASSTSACSSCGTPVTSEERYCPDCGQPTGVNPDNSEPTSGAQEQARAAWDAVTERLRAAVRESYDLEGELGRGGMAAVYLAYDRALRRRVAIKVMSPGLLLNPTAIERFNREARMMAALEHPHIARVYAVKDQPVPYFTMQYVAGRTLDQALRAVHRLPLAVVQGVLYQVAEALGYAHRKGVIHRDIKPSNIMLDEQGRAIVMDFGIAKAVEGTQSGATGGPIGTVEYMSPEQILVKPLAGASDQYSLGVLAYQLLSGRLPFEGPTGQVMVAHVQQQPEPLGRRLPGCPAKVSAGIARMLAKDPQQRFPDVMAAVRAIGASAVTGEDVVSTYLQALATGQALPDLVSGPSVRGAGRRGQRWNLTPGRAIAAVGGLGLVATLAWLAFGPDSVGDGKAGKEDSVTQKLDSTAGLPGSGSGVVLQNGQGKQGKQDSGTGHENGADSGTSRGPGKKEGSATGAGGPALGSIRLEAAQTSIDVGDTVAVDARAAGSAAPLRPRWTLSGAAVAAIDPLTGSATGRLRLIGRDTGSARLGVTAEGYQPAALDLRVSAPAVVTVTIMAPPESLIVGQRSSLGAVARDGRGRPLPAARIRWSVDRGDLAAVDGAGTLAASRAGDLVVTAAAGDRQGTARVRIVAAASDEPPPDARTAILAKGQVILDLISARDVDQIGRLYRAEPGTAADWKDKLLVLIREDLLSATMGAHEATVDGATATASLQVTVRYQDPVAGGRRNGTLRFLARYSRLGSDWNLNSLSLTQKPPN